MEVLYLLIPLSFLLVGAIVAGFLWALRRGQFDDLERHGRDVLFEQDEPRERVRDDEQP